MALSLEDRLTATALVLQRRRIPRRKPIEFSRMVKRIADQHGVQAATAWTEAVLRHQKAIDLAALRSAIASKNARSIEAVVGAGKLQASAGRALRQPFTAAAQLTGARSAAILKAHGLVASFNAVHPNVVNYAREQAAQLVVGVPAETKRVIAEVIALGSEHSLDVAQQARAIREVVGLPPNWANAPLNLRDEIKNGREAAATSRRLSAATKQQIRSRIAAGTVTDAFLDDVEETYAASLVNRRALNIARTETNRAAHNGLNESWRQAQEQGVLPDGARRFWIVTPDDRLRATHARIPLLNPNGRELDEPFELADGRRVMTPPADPNCRCSIGLLPNVPEGFDVTEGAEEAEPLRSVAEPDEPSELIQGAIRNRTAAGGAESSRFPMPEGGGRALDDWVSTGPVQDGPFYRQLSLSGEAADIRHFEVGKEIGVGRGRISDSWSLRADRAPLQGGDVFVRIEARTLRGRDISQWSIFPEEKEFLSPATARYRVVERIQMSPGNWRVRVEQIGAESSVTAIEIEAQALYESTYGVIPRTRPMWSQLPEGRARARFLEQAQKNLTEGGTRGQLPRAGRRAVRPTFGGQPTPSAPPSNVQPPRVAPGSKAPSAETHRAMVETARKMGVDPSVVEYRSSLGSLKVGGRRGSVVGEYKNGQIRMSSSLTPREMQQHFAHEAQHLKFDVAVRSDPAIQRFVEKNFRTLEFDDGITAYSREHWAQFMFSRPLRGTTPWRILSIPVDETLAEMRAFARAGGSEVYKKLFKLVDDAYERAVARGFRFSKRPGAGGLRSVVPTPEVAKPPLLDLYRGELPEETERNALSKHLDKRFKNVAPAAGEELVAIDNYMTHHYSTINNSLRSGDVEKWILERTGGDRKLLAERLQDIKSMDALMARMPELGETATVWRSVPNVRWIARGQTERAILGNPRALIGTEFADAGYASTTTLSGAARGWSRLTQNGGTLVEIRLPPSTRGMWAKTVAGEAQQSAIVKREYLLPRGARFKVVDARAEGDILHVIVEYLS